MTAVRVRAASGADIAAITAIARATGQDEEWDLDYPHYLRHVLARGEMLVGESRGDVAGFGATVPIRLGAGPVSMLTDLFVHPAAHGRGVGRALLRALWPGDGGRRMTFSSLHAHALPLYASFGLDAWWPLLYLSGTVTAVRRPAGWSVRTAAADEAAALERGWTGADRSEEYRMWAARPEATAVVASRDGEPVAAGAAGGPPAEFGIIHLAVAVPGEAGSVDRDAVAAAAPGAAGPADPVARDAVAAVLSWLAPAAGGQARVCLPALHPAVRPLLAAGWRASEFDLFMATEPGLIDPRRAVPSSGLA